MDWMVFSLKPTAGSRVWCSYSTVPPPSILSGSLATLGTERIAFFPPPLNLPLFGALSETISVIELSIWQFIYDKGVITQ